MVIAALASVGSSGTAAKASTGPQLMPAAGQFVPVTPVTVLDTRNGTGGVAVAPVAAGATVTVPVEGVGTIPSSGVTDVFTEISALNVTGSGALEAYSTNIADPGIWTVPITAGQASTVADMTQVGQDGYVSVTNTASSGSADVLVRVMGYVQDGDATTAGDTYVALQDHGVLDSQTGLGDPNGVTEVPAGGSVTFSVLGQGVPADAAGVAIYLGTAGDGTASGYLSVYPAGAADPNARVVDYQPGHVVHNLYFGAMSSSGQLTMKNHGAKPVDVKAAVQGYLASPTSSEAGSTYTGVTPARIVDTRNGTGGVAAVPVPANSSITFPVAGVAGVPSSGVSAVAESVAALNPVKTGYLTTYAAGGTDPNNGVVNFTANDVQDNDLTTPLVSSVSPTGEETISNHSSGTVDVVVTVKGYYTAPTVPGKPTMADAGIDSSGTITVTWQPPATDGGAAITGYQVTVYNSDGSVNQTDSYDPGTTSATISGLNASATYTISVSAVNAVGTNSTTAAAVNAIPAGWTAPGTQGADINVDMSYDPSADSLAVSSVSGDTSSYSSDGALLSQTADSTASTSANVYPSSGLGNYACIIKTNDGLHTYTPWHNYGSWPEGTGDFTHFLYTKSNARHLWGNGGHWTFQSMLCTTGGAQAAGGYHLVFAGDAVTLGKSTEYKIGQNWGTGRVNGSVAATLSFQIQAGIATIGASLPVGGGNGNYLGDIGADGKFPGWPWGSYNRNRVNTFYQAPHNFPWDGSTGYQGNVSEVLTEWPMGTSGPFHWKTHAYMLVFCPNPLGC